LITLHKIYIDGKFKGCFFYLNGKGGSYGDKTFANGQNLCIFADLILKKIEKSAKFLCLLPIFFYKISKRFVFSLFHTESSRNENYRGELYFEMVDIISAKESQETFFNLSEIAFSLA
jgi:hypothetical protein